MFLNCAAHILQRAYTWLAGRISTGSAPGCSLRVQWAGAHTAANIFLHADCESDYFALSAYLSHGLSNPNIANEIVLKRQTFFLFRTRFWRSKLDAFDLLLYVEFMEPSLEILCSKWFICHAWSKLSKNSSSSTSCLHSSLNQEADTLHIRISFSGFYTWKSMWWFSKDSSCADDLPQIPNSIYGSGEEQMPWELWFMVLLAAKNFWTACWG